MGVSVWGSGAYWGASFAGGMRPQSWAGCLGRALVFVWNSALGVFVEIFLIFPNFLRFVVFSCSRTRVTISRYHFYYLQSCFVSLVVKVKFGKTSKSLKYYDHGRLSVVKQAGGTCSVFTEQKEEQMSF